MDRKEKCQDEMTSSLGLTTKKALAILRDQLTTLLEGHQKERKKSDFMEGGMEKQFFVPR